MSTSKCDVSDQESGCRTKEVVLTADLEALILKVIEDYKLKPYTISKRCVNNPGEGFMGRLYEIKVREVEDGGKLELNFFVKCIYPDVDAVLFPVRGVFMREIFVYEELSKVYENLQAEVGIPSEDTYDFVQCFAVCKNRGSEALILDDMTAKGYKTYDKNDIVSMEFAKFSMIRLAKFHALSYALETTRREYFHSKVRPLVTQYRFDEVWTKFVWNTAQVTLDLYHSTPLHQKLKDFVGETLKKFPAYYAPVDRSVLCHGDYRPSNILKKEEEGVLREVLPVDYQIAQLCSPIIDLVYFFFAGADRTFRNAHMDDLKALYRDTARAFLARFNIDLEEVYPSKEFEKDFKEKLDYGLMIGLVFLPYILVEPEHAPDLGSVPVTDVRIRAGPLFRERMREIVEDFERWGYL